MKSSESNRSKSSRRLTTNSISTIIGCRICIGKGNPDWNYSAPHGAGRLMSRKKAKESLSLEEFADNMKDVYSSSVCAFTLDEAPMAYKPMQSIVDAIQETVDIQNIIRPIYNFKAKE